jgi:hypothetical protein
MTWVFSDEFGRRAAARVDRLCSWQSYADVVQAIIATSTLRRDSVRWETRKSDPSIERVEFELQADGDAVDALFNSAHGYRAQFLVSVACGVEANALILRDLLAKHGAEVANLLPRDAHRAERSLCATEAKIWMKQDRRVTLALIGKATPEIEIAVPEWVQRLDEQVLTSHGPRYLARAGVLATSSRGTIDVKGAWLTGDERWPDPDKAERSVHIRNFGFS